MSAQTCVCSACEKHYVVVPDEDASDAPPKCACGGTLTEMSLPPGVHELKSPRRAKRRKVRAAPEGPPARAREEVEANLGYGESHGYGPAHGGPTGPGDAPAPSTSDTETERTS